MVMMMPQMRQGEVSKGHDGEDGDKMMMRQGKVDDDDEAR
jgi:hypothetical protein